MHFISLSFFFIYLDFSLIQLWIDFSISDIFSDFIFFNFSEQNVGGTTNSIVFRKYPVVLKLLFYNYKFRESDLSFAITVDSTARVLILKELLLLKDLYCVASKRERLKTSQNITSCYFSDS